MKSRSASDLQKDPGLHYRVVVSCGHYYVDEPEIAGLRETLFEKLARDRKMNPERDVIESVKEAVFRYVKNFNLIDVNKKMAQVS